MTEPTAPRPFFMRARTRSLTRWGVISILAALCVLGITATNDPAETAPMVAKAIFRADDAAPVEGYPEFAHFRGDGRNIFRFAEPPKPKIVQSAPTNPIPLPKPKPVPPPKPKAPALNTSGLQVHGIIATTNGNGWAIISGLDKHEVVIQQGDTVRGATVTRIDTNQVTLEKDGVVGNLTLKKSYMPFAPESPSAGKGPSPATAEENESPAPPPRQRSLGLSVRLHPSGQGLLVTKVNRIDIDIQPGDIVTAIEGNAITGLARARDLLSEAKQKDAVRLSILRAGLAKAVTISMVE